MLQINAFTFTSDWWGGAVGDVANLMNTVIFSEEKYERKVGEGVFCKPKEH